MFPFLCQSAQIKELCSKTTKRLLTSRFGYRKFFYENETDGAHSLWKTADFFQPDNLLHSFWTNWLTETFYRSFIKSKCKKTKNKRLFVVRKLLSYAVAGFLLSLIFYGLFKPHPPWWHWLWRQLSIKYWSRQSSNIQKRFTFFRDWSEVYIHLKHIFWFRPHVWTNIFFTDC